MSGEVELADAADFELGSLRVQPSTLQLHFGGESRSVEPRVMQALVALAATNGNVVSRDRLVELCWGGRAVSEDAINRCIAKVRRFGAETGAFEVETIPRVGYRLVPAEELAGGPTARRFGTSALVALAAILFVVLVAGGLLYWRSTPEVPQPKVAVLPFTPLNSDAETRHVGESIAATVGNALVQTGALLPDANIRTIDDARRSGAAVIISGNIRRDGSTFSVTARVDSARQGSTLLTNEFQAASDQAQPLAGQVAEWLTPPIRMWASFLPLESDSRTTDEILRIFLTRQAGDGLRASNLSRSLANANPNSGAAQLVLVLLTSDSLDKIAPEQREPAVETARKAAKRAARLLPDPGRAQAVLDCHLTAPGWLVLTPRCDGTTRAEISSNPDVPLLPFLFGQELTDVGRFAEAVKFADMDLAQSPFGSGQIGLRIFSTRMASSDEADDPLPQLEERMRRFAGPGPLAYIRFRVAIANGDMTAAKSFLDAQTGSSVPHGHFWDGMTTIRSGEGRSVIELVLRAVRSKSADDIRAMQNGCSPPQLNSTPPDPAFGACLVGLTLVGDLDEAFALANRGYRDVDCCSAAEQEHQWLMTGGIYHPRAELFGKAMAPARADPRFVELARRTGLLAYWKSGHPPDFCSFERVPVCALLRQ